MKKKTKEINARLRLWLAGEIDDTDLSDEEVRELERRVFGAVADKMLARQDVHTFADHETMQ